MSDLPGQTTGAGAPPGQEPGHQQPQQPVAYSGNGPSGPRAGFWARFGAVIIDSILVGIVQGIITVALSDSPGAIYAISTLIGWAYYTYFEGGERGQTIGKMALSIRVIGLQDGRPIGYGRAFVRQLVKIVSGLAFGLGYLWMLWDREKQCWHDKAAGSVVVPTSAYPVSS
jgi:uncharacterized RDD family membrane protein YckC